MQCFSWNLFVLRVVQAVLCPGSSSSEPGWASGEDTHPPPPTPHPLLTRTDTAGLILFSEHSSSPRHLLRNIIALHLQIAKARSYNASYQRMLYTVTIGIKRGSFYAIIFQNCFMNKAQQQPFLKHSFIVTIFKYSLKTVKVYRKHFYSILMPNY